MSEGKGDEESALLAACLMRLDAVFALYRKAVDDGMFTEGAGPSKAACKCGDKVHAG
jgi:hypothetical protein